ncbi:uncharacterized protein LOC117642414 [Thrips palmi]|uniref:Uncharacterized protein LOC117642414 n=1 Tax=Thrips palmi TaxID=161013 RepID=A0A6P8ZK50_THRPL|nr:uncharacterized protein LOC117642414 [Thrips palmi]
MSLCERVVMHCFRRVFRMKCCVWLLSAFCLLFILSTLNSFHGDMVALNRVRKCRGTQPQSWIYHVNDGWQYRRNVYKRGTMYLKCVKKDCPGSALCDRPRGFLHTKAHTHRRDRLYPMVLQLRRRILNRCRSLEFISFRRILVQESRRYPIRVQVRLRLAKIRSAMQRARAKMFPPAPDTLRELTRILQDPRYRIISATHDARDSLYAASVTADDQSHHIIFMSRRMARVARSLDLLFADGTFKVKPAIDELDEASQVFALVGNWDRTVIPLGWVLMQRRTTSAYEAVFRTLRILLRGGDNFRTVITDFESATRRAFANIFPHLRRQGCFFHLVRAIIKYAKDVLLMTRLLRLWPYSELIKCFCCLALLPVRFMRRGFLILLRLTRDQGVRIYRNMRMLIDYIRRRWVAHPIRKHWMCVYGSFHRTNNTSESHNKMLANFIGVHHPNTYNFIDALGSMEANAYADAMALAIGEKPNRGRKLSAIALDQRLRTLYRSIRNPPGDLDAAILRFLRAAAHTFDNAYDRAVQEV